MDPITGLQAQTLKVLSSPLRLEILHRLADGPLEVGRLAGAVGASQPNVSQHLALMRAVGIVEAERDGREIRYRLTDPDVIVACQLMRGVLERRLSRLARLADPNGAEPTGVPRGPESTNDARAVEPHALPSVG